MRHIISSAVSGAIACGFVAAVAAPAAASPAGTTTTFVVSSGSLAISAPTSASLGTISVGTTTVSGSLGAVSVTDSRGLLSGGWTASVISTSFTNGTTTVPASSIQYTAGLPTVSSGLSAIVPGSGTLSPTTPLTAETATLSINLGGSSATWNPTIQVTLPSVLTTGTYTATITHSVA
jgi:hypothetical protein